MSEDYDIQAAIVIDERPSLQSIALIEKRLLGMQRTAMIAGFEMAHFFGQNFGAMDKQLRGFGKTSRKVATEITHWMGKSFAHVANSPETKSAFRSLEQRAQATGRRMGASLSGGFPPRGGSGGGGGMGFGGGLLGGLGLGGMLGGVGGLMGAGAGVRGIIGMHTEIENAVGSIGTSFSVFNKMPIEEAMSSAREQIKLLEKDAASGVGSLDNYVETFNLLASAGTGRSNDDLRALTKQTLTAGSTRGSEGMRQAPLDIIQALGQGVNDKMTPFAMKAVQAAGLTGEAFNKLGKSAKIDVLMKGFSAFDEGAKVMGRSWEARMDTFKDGVKALARDLTKPLFARWSGQLADANGWLERNADRLGAIVDDWGPKLVTMWDHLIGKAGIYASIVAGAAVAQQLPGAGGAGGKGGLMGQVKDAGGLLSGGGVRMLLTGLTRLALPIAIVSTGFAVMYSALQTYPDLLESARATGADLAGALGSLAGAFSSLHGPASLLTMLGVPLVMMFQSVAHKISFVVKVIATAIELLGLTLTSLLTGVEQAWATVKMMGAWVGIGTQDGSNRAQFKDAEQRRDVAFMNFDVVFKGIWATADEEKKKKGEEGGAGGAGGAGKKEPAVGAGNVNIAKVEVVVRSEVNSDPTRVGMAFEEFLGHANKYRRQARRLTGPAAG